MISKRLGGVCAAIGLALGLGGCADDYGYGGMSAGYGSGGYYGDPYGDGYGYGGYGGYGYPSNYGWYGDYYYPGTGIYVYDQYRRAYRWNDGQRRYWSNQQRYRGRDWNGQGSWNGFDRRQYDDGRRWQRDGNRQWQGNDGNRQRQQDRNGYVPNPGYQGNPGARADGRTVSPQQPRDPGRWQGRGAERSGGQWQGRRGGGGSAARRGADTSSRPAD